MRLTDDEIDLIRDSFLTIARDAERAGETFYAELFRIAPDTRRLFVNDMGKQAGKLMSTLGLVVSQLQSWLDIAPVVEDLAQRHVAYGVEPEHYGAVGRALDVMLQDALDDAYQPAVRAAWTRAYAELSAFMIETAYRDETVD